jgi:hypothetical protein
MNQKRIPLRVVFLSVSMVFIAAVVILQFLLSGQSIFHMPRSDDVQTSPGVIETKTGMANSDNLSSSPLESDSGITFDMNLHSATAAQGNPLPTFPESSEYQVIQLVIPELNIDASVGSVALIPWEEGASRFDGRAATPGSARGHYLETDPAGKAENLNIDGQSYVNIEAIRDMLGLDADAQFTVYNLSSDFLINAAQLESYNGQYQPIVIMLDNARWILPEGGGRMQIATSWPDDMGQGRFVILAKPQNAAADSEIPD